MERETADDIKHHFDIVAESLTSKIQTVAEAVIATRDELKRDMVALEERLTQRMDTIAVVVRGHTEDIHATRVKVDQMDQRLERVDQRLERVEQKLDRKADVETVAALDGRVASLEREHHS